MIQFNERVEKLLEPHGVASDRLNRDVMKLVTEAYCEGMRDWAVKGHDLELEAAIAQVVKRRGPLP